MLKKLCSHEWKDTLFINTLACSIVGILTIIMIIAMMTQSFTQVFGSGYAEETFLTMNMFIMFTFTMYYFSIWACVMVIRYYFFYRYYKNLFTDQGYLMHTLPVKKTELINAKLIIGTIWQYLSYVVVAVSVLLSLSIGSYRIHHFNSNDHMGYWSFVGNALNEAWKIFTDASDGLIPLVICIIIVVFLLPVTELLLFYVSICLGQLSKKNRLMISILILVGLNMARSFVISVLTVPFMLTFMHDPTKPTINIISVVITLLIIAATVLLYILNRHMVEKKLNLE